MNSEFTFQKTQKEGTSHDQASIAFCSWTAFRIKLCARVRKRVFMDFFKNSDV